MIVKICGITNREDALAAVEGGASALGFNFYPQSPRYVTPEQAAGILAAVPAGVWTAGIFVNEPVESIRGTVTALGLDIAQVYGDAAALTGMRVWKALAAGPDFDPRQLEEYDAEAFLLDTPAGPAYGGTGRTYNWSVARGASRKVIVAGGLDETNVAEAIRQARPWGVDACSRLEASPGRKDHTKLARFLKAALSENL